MTRKDFVAIAEAISATRSSTFDMPQGMGDATRLVLDITADRIADHLAMVNPRFDRPRFLTACGVKNA